jgi:dipeptidyl aminopeptidase/acylaminoacyl peptidase
MKSARVVYVTSITLLTILTVIAIPLRLVAQERPDTPAFPGKNGRIVWKGFVFADFSTSAIYSAKHDGSDVQQLTSPDPGLQDDLPKWSPDGSKIIFDHATPDTGVIREMNWDGTGLHEVGKCVVGKCIAQGNADYSPDGKKVVFIKVLGSHGTITSIGVWIMNADGTNPRQLTKPENSADSEPAWSPDGKQIAFTRANGTAQALFLVHPDGKGLHRLTKWFINAGGARRRGIHGNHSRGNRSSEEFGFRRSDVRAGTDNECGVSADSKNLPNSSRPNRESLTSAPHSRRDLCSLCSVRQME